MNYWIFKCNNNMYDLEKRLQNPNPTITWNVTRYKDKVKKGDLVFLWMSGKNNGVRAVFEVDTPPVEMTEIQSEKPYWRIPGEVGKTRHRVVGTLLHKKSRFIPSETIKNNDALKDMSVFGYTGASNYPLTEKQGKALLKVVSVK